jgi:hypothetical protein
MSQEILTEKGNGGKKETKYEKYSSYVQKFGLIKCYVAATASRGEVRRTPGRFC